MCGIIGCYVEDPSTIREEILVLYAQQASRGVDGFGLYIQNPVGGTMRVRAKNAKYIFEHVVWERIQVGAIVLFHHRWPTSTPNVSKCNHPIRNETKSMALAHNGIVSISQYVDLPKKHTFETENPDFGKPDRVSLLYQDEYTDSEYALHAMEELMAQGKSPMEALHQIGEDNWHSSFLVVRRGEQTIYWATNDQDLVYIDGSMFPNHYILSSYPSGDDIKNKWGTFGPEGLKVVGEYEEFLLLGPVVSQWEPYFGPISKKAARKQKRKAKIEQKRLEIAWGTELAEVMTESEQIKDYIGCYETQICAECQQYDECQEQFAWFAPPGGYIPDESNIWEKREKD